MAVQGLPFFGARFSLYAMTDRYVPVILGSIEALGDRGLEVETDDVSTFIGGDRNAIWSSLEDVFARAARTGDHVVMSAQVSHGCPGETYCEPDARTGMSKGPVERAGAGVRVACQWSLYPLGVPDYMDVIYREIDRTKSAGVFRGGAHFVSRLDGELPVVLAAIRRSFDEACASAGHVVAHLTLSANSPTGRDA